MWLRTSCIVLATLLLGSAAAGAQSAGDTWQPGHAGLGFAAPPANQQWVRMVSSPDIVLGHNSPAASAMRLQFTVRDGLHINSHHPRSRYDVPTTLTLHPSSGVEIAKIEYPPGSEIHSQYSPKEVISAYGGTFSVVVHVRAGPGLHTLRGQLRYQACDDRTCSPPKNLPVVLNITAN
jgi:DsbC/DsbD-like thiol-disulfide interchange protein